MAKKLGRQKLFLSLLLVECQLKGCTANSSVASSAGSTNFCSHLFCQTWVVEVTEILYISSIYSLKFPPGREYLRLIVFALLDWDKGGCGLQLLSPFSYTQY